MLVLFRIVKFESSSQYDADTVIDISQGNDSQPQQIPVGCEKICQSTGSKFYRRSYLGFPFCPTEKNVLCHKVLHGGLCCSEK